MNAHFLVSVFKSQFSRLQWIRWVPSNGIQMFHAKHRLIMRIQLNSCHGIRSECLNNNHNSHGIVSGELPLLLMLLLMYSMMTLAVGGDDGSGDVRLASSIFIINLNIIKWKQCQQWQNSRPIQWQMATAHIIIVYKLQIWESVYKYHFWYCTHRWDVCLELKITNNRSVRLCSQCQSIQHSTFFEPYISTLLSLPLLQTNRKIIYNRFHIRFFSIPSHHSLIWLQIVSFRKSYTFFVPKISISALVWSGKRKAKEKKRENLEDLLAFCMVCGHFITLHWLQSVTYIGSRKEINGEKLPVNV